MSSFKATCSLHFTSLHFMLQLLDMESTQSQTRKKRSFDIVFKLKVVMCAEQSTNRGAAAKYSVDEKSIRIWRKNKASLQALPSEKKRLEGGGRKPLNLDMEDNLLAWINELRASNLRVTRSQIQRKALELSEGQVSLLYHVH